MEIIRAEESDIEKIKKIYDIARNYMKENGNPNQWDNGYPDENIIRQDILENNCYIVMEKEKILGVFVLFIGEEPTYKVIQNGAWHHKGQYGTIHRVASTGEQKGIAFCIFDFCLKKINYLRIDTHNDNKIMQSVIEKYGFKRCGIINVRNGERIAFDFKI